MSERAALIHRYYEALNRGDWVAWEACVSEHLDHHTPHMPPGRMMFQHVLRTFLVGFPDLRHEILEIVEGETMVAVYTRSQGTHQGTFLGHPPTGATFTADAIEMLTIHEGRIVARRAVFDTLGMLQQLGLYQPVPHMGGAQ